VTRQKITAEGDDREKTAAIRLIVSANSWTGAELRSLPRGGSIRIEVQSDGPVRLLMADAESYKSFPDIEKTLFDRQIERSFVADITLPLSGDYYLIADNRSGNSPREVLLGLRGRAHDANEAMEFSRQFEVLQRQMDAAFDLRGLTLQLVDSGPVRPSITERRLVVGRHFIHLIEAELPDEKTAKGAILFAIMHAIASDWLAADRLPASVLPEHLATALMILFNQIDSARRQADHFAARGTTIGPQPPAGAGPADPLSTVTARSVQQRLKDPQSLLREMQEAILPRMRPEMLEQLRRDAPRWADQEKVAAALAVHENRSSRGESME